MMRPSAFKNLESCGTTRQWYFSASFNVSSVDPPSSLPLFKSLARRIGEDAGVTASEQDLDTPDRFLGDLAARTDVHRRVADLLGNEESQSTVLHAALLHLAVAQDSRHGAKVLAASKVGLASGRRTR